MELPGILVKELQNFSGLDFRPLALEWVIPEKSQTGQGGGVSLRKWNFQAAKGGDIGKKSK